MEASIFASAVAFGLTGLAIYAFVEKVLPVLPSFPFLIFVGMFGGGSSGGVMVSLIAITLGSTFGAMALFFLGRRVNEQKMRSLTARFGRYVMLPLDRYDDLVTSYRRRHFVVTLVGQLMPGTRNITPISAGTLGIAVIPFLFATMLSGLAWNASFLTLGYTLAH